MNPLRRLTPLQLVKLAIAGAFIMALSFLPAAAIWLTHDRGSIRGSHQPLIGLILVFLPILVGGILVGAARWTIWDCLISNTRTESETKAVWDWFELPRVKRGSKMAALAMITLYLSWNIFWISAWRFKVISGSDVFRPMNAVWFFIFPFNSLIGLNAQFRPDPPRPDPPDSFPGTAFGLRSSHWGHPTKEVQPSSD